MNEHQVHFEGVNSPVRVPTGTLLVEAAAECGLEIGQPCGGQGRCGRCAVQIVGGTVRSRSTLRLSPEDIARGYVLACQAVVEADAEIVIPPQEQIERRLTSDRTAVEVEIPAGYDPRLHQSLRRLHLSLTPPSMDDQTDDWSRLQVALTQKLSALSLTPDHLATDLPLLRQMGPLLRQADWQVTALVDCHAAGQARLLALYPHHVPGDEPLWGLAVDIGTTTVSVWLVDLLTGAVLAQSAEYNRQISRGEDVISRIIYAAKNEGGETLRRLVLETINKLVERLCSRSHVDPQTIFKATIAGNSTMMHLLLGLPAESIRQAPFVTALNQPPSLTAAEVGLDIHPAAHIDCLPGVASYVGADITAGVLASGVDDEEAVSLFLDIGTNGEMVLGNHDWLVTCACSAGPAFEGAGVADGMRATRGAIEEVWINGENYEPTLRVIGLAKPRGLCGSGLISLLAELFLIGLVDKRGRFNEALDIPRLRQGDHGWEYVLAWSAETETGRDIVITHVDIDNLIRAKAAIYAGFSVLADSVGLPLEAVERVLIGGAFGKYINVEKALEIGLLPDMPWEQFHFLGNTSVRGAYMALLDHRARQRIAEIGRRMTYIELSADNAFFEAFMSASFLPHTDLSRFPSLAERLAALPNGAAVKGIS